MMSLFSRFLKFCFFILSFVFADIGPVDATTFIAGMGRSGTTWVEEVINYNHDYRIIFEPFHAFRVADAFCFKYHNYIRPETVDPTLEKQARIILSGHVQNSWTDHDKKSLRYSKRIIKDI